MNKNIIWAGVSLLAISVGIVLIEIFSNEDGKNTDDNYFYGRLTDDTIYDSP